MHEHAWRKKRQEIFQNVYRPYTNQQARKSLSESDKHCEENKYGSRMRW
jgi:hypothetical protein